MGLAMHNHVSVKRVFPIGAELRDINCCAGDVYSGWTREILPFVEDDSLKGLYDSEKFSVTSADPNVKKFCEMTVPLYSCPSDDPMELALPEAGSGAGIQFRTSSYKANAGRTDGFTTFYLYESMPPASGTVNHGNGNVERGWRGPVHAQMRSTSKTPPGVPIVGTYELHPEAFKDIIDGTTKTMLIGESTSLNHPGRRPFWTYTFGTMIMAQTVNEDIAFMYEYDRCVTLTRSATYPGMSQRVCKGGWGSRHPGGMNAVMCDGLVQFIPFTIDLQVFAAMGSIAGGENEATGF
jgi:prepilin-type processing-associated H-X9-DG protein